MELAFQPFRFEPLENCVDAVGNNESRAVGAFRQKIAHGAIQRPGHADGFPFASQQSKGAVDLAHGFRRAVKNALARLIDSQVVNAIGRRADQINDLFEGLVHGLLFRRFAGNVEAIFTSATTSTSP